MTNIIDRQTRSRIVKLVHAVAPEVDGDNATEAAALEIFACSAWSGLGEPGDRMVRLLTDRMGAFASLEAIVSGATAKELSVLLHDFVPRDGDPVSGIESALAEALERWLPRLNQNEAIAHLERAQRIGAKILTEGSVLWPAGLDALAEHRPIALWVRGNTERLADLERSVSIVGARASTGYGEHVTMEVTGGLVDAGFAIVSGAAYGIDGMAHRAALASGGSTLAVLAGGIDRLYPSGHDALLHRIIDAGAIITELPCGFAPTKWRFLQRNRLIAALSQATVVVEAGWRSGSLNTAHHALELDRPLGVIPGPVTSASSAGCHRLLRETPAVCVTNAEEIMALVSPESQPSTIDFESDASTVHPFAIRVLDCMSNRKGRASEELAKVSGLSPAETLAVLGLLELGGMVREVPTGWIKQSA
jgi:DNA processing protein